MNRDEDAIFAEALRWHAMCDDDSMDWDSFTAWLESDARHREAYDAVAIGDALLAEHGSSLRSDPAVVSPANDDESNHSGVMGRAGRRSWLRWAGGAIAASLVAVLTVPQLLSEPTRTYSTASASQSIALEDGSSVLLAPHSTLAIEGRRQERMALAGGALFDIRHDPARELAITAGAVEIGDIGTRFDVQETQGLVRVAVAEGEVQVRSASLAQPIRLTKGRGLTYDATAKLAAVRSVGEGTVGEWQSGRLTYDAAPLPLVAADLARYAGVKVTVARGLRDRQFTGTLVVNDGETALRDLSQLMGLELRRSAAGLVLDQSR